MSDDATQHNLQTGQKVFGRYSLKKILGQGGMGIVWLARDDELERDVALKFLPDLVMLDKALLGALKHETRRSLELTHKNIVRIYDFVQSENSACISMEYIDGDTLSNLRAEKEQKVFQPNELSAWTAQLCEALDYAHNHARIIHRDLKPANLLVNQRGDLKVSDFGIARSLGDSMSKLTMVSGTSGTLVYMSPQQFDGERGTHLEDIYSLGATLYDLLTSKPPFYSGNLDKQIHERVAPSMTERRKEFNLEPALVPQIWEETVAACLAKDPRKRPQSATEVAQRLGLTHSGGRAVPLEFTGGSRKKVILVAAGIGLLIALSSGTWYSLVSRAPRNAATSPSLSAPEKSVAVLPLESLSEDKSDAFVAEGIQDDILAALSKIGDLKVISRASVTQYKKTDGAARNLREIAKTLGVQNVLEGSVRHAGDRLLVKVQLTDVVRDRLVWAERYDRTIADSITLQGELAVEIAAALRAKLSRDEEARVSVRPTQSADAYLLYLRARELPAGTATYKGLENIRMRERYYTEALALDPDFALAHATLSALLAYIYHDFQPEDAVKNRARAEAEEALRLQPDLGEGHFARGLCLYYTEKNYEAALGEFDTAAQLLPNNAEVGAWGGFIRRRQGRWKEALESFERALVRDPRNPSILSAHFATLYFLRDWAGARRAAERALAAASGAPTLLRIEKNYLNIWSAGDLVPLRESLAGAPAGFDPDGGVTLARWDSALMARDFAAAERAITESVAETILAGHGIPVPKKYFLGCVAIARGDAQGAESLFEEARPRMEAEVLGAPQEPFRHAQLGLLYALMGRHADAMREGARAVELAPIEKDAIYGAQMLGLLAAICARAGEHERAIELIERLLVTPAAVLPAFEGSITLAELRLRWHWDPLRENARFRAILAGPEPKTVY